MDIWQTIISFLDLLGSILGQYASDPLLYSIAFFIYTFLATIILPLPVEIGLLLSPGTPILLLAIVLGLGRMAGSTVVYYTGLGIGASMRKWSDRWEWSRRSMNLLEQVITRLGYLGLYIIMSIPLMPDTIPLYIYCISNEKDTFKGIWFSLTNFFAGFTRAFVFLALLSLFGLGFFHTFLGI